MLICIPPANSLDFLESSVSPQPRRHSHEMLREEARQILRTRLCGNCHIPPGISKALNIYNLDHENWTAGLKNSQLLEFKWRILVKGDEVKAQNGDPRKHEFSTDEIKFIENFVDREIAARNPALHLFN